MEMVENISESKNAQLAEAGEFEFASSKSAQNGHLLRILGVGFFPSSQSHQRQRLCQEKRNPPNGSWEMVQVLSTKTSPPEFSATSEVSKYLETNSGILKDRLAKYLNMHFETCRKGWIMKARPVAKVTGKTSQMALNCLGLFIERT